MRNGHSSAHGSVLFAIADTAFATACNSHGHRAIGRSCAIEYLAPAFPGDALSAYAVERAHEGRTGSTTSTSGATRTTRSWRGFAR